MRLTKSQKETILKYERQIRMAGTSHCVTGIPVVGLLKLVEIYNDLLSKNETVNTSCSHCVITFLARFYNQIYKDSILNADNK